MSRVWAIVAGMLFGAGLVLSGMSDPAKVLGFLDLFGHWDPSLALVMVGAIGAAIGPIQWVERRGRTLAGVELQLPGKTRLDARLIGGSLLFGMGWGIAGFCPGPALVALGSGVPLAALFVVCMLAGMWLAGRLPVRG